MMKQYVVGVLCAGVLATAVALPPVVQAQTPDRAALLAQIEQLMKVLVSLQAQLDATKGELSDLIASANLEEGMENEDVRKVQELLASDPTLFAGQPTGYFGPMTRQAILRFQERYGLEQTGRLDEATREAMNELRKERKNGVVPPGLLQSEAAKQRVRDRLQEKWGDCDFTRPLREQACERVKDKKDGTEGDAKKPYEDKKWNKDRDDDGDVDEDDITDAKKEIREAQAKLAVLERILQKREYGSRVSQMMVDRAQARLRDARAALRAAEAKLETEPEAAEELAEVAEELIEEGADAVGEEDILDEVEEMEDEDEEDEEDEDDEDDEEDDESNS